MSNDQFKAIASVLLLIAVLLELMLIKLHTLGG